MAHIPVRARRAFPPQESIRRQPPDFLRHNRIESPYQLELFDGLRNWQSTETIVRPTALRVLHELSRAMPGKSRRYFAGWRNRM